MTLYITLDVILVLVKKLVLIDAVSCIVILSIFMALSLG